MASLSRIFSTFIMSLAFAGLSTSCSQTSDKEEIIVAVATNFITTAEDLKTAFETQTNYRVILVSGSTGKLYAQIKSGAPYDVFLAADQERPKLINETSFTYAIGQLVFYAPNNEANETTLRDANVKHLAIANPDLAPYGRAAMETLSSLEVRNAYANKLVLGENVGQALAMVKTGNADYGLIARSSVNSESGNFWLIPQDHYNPIKQDAVILSDKEGALELVSFLKSDVSRNIISANGYTLP